MSVTALAGRFSRPLSQDEPLVIACKARDSRVVALKPLLEQSQALAHLVSTSRNRSLTRASLPPTMLASPRRRASGPCATTIPLRLGGRASRSSVRSRTNKDRPRCSSIISCCDWFSFPRDTAPRFLLRDRDGSYGTANGLMRWESRRSLRRRAHHGKTLTSRGSSARSAESVWTTTSYSINAICVGYFRPTSSITTAPERISLDNDCADPRPVQPPRCGRVVALPQVAGLHHRYERLAA
jgi:hypothetical protein